MIMLPLHWRRLGGSCRHAAASRCQALPTLTLATALPVAMHSRPKVPGIASNGGTRAAKSWQLLAPDAQLPAPAWTGQPRSDAALRRHAAPQRRSKVRPHCTRSKQLWGAMWDRQRYRPC